MNGRRKAEGGRRSASDTGRGRLSRLPPPAYRLSRNKGFTLIEILAAFVIFALAFGAVMQALSGSIRNTVQSRGYTQAALAARSVMDELTYTEPLRPGTLSGELENDYRWEMTVSEYEPEDAMAADGNLTPVVQLYRVDLTIYWGEPSRERQASFTTLRAVRPEL